MRLTRRTLATVTAIAACAIASPLTTTAEAHSPAPHGHTVSTAFTLPGERVYPEGIAADPRTGDVYVGSNVTGAVYRAGHGQSAAEVFLPAGTDGRNTANGLRVDRAGRLWVIDSTKGVTVYDLRSRARIARFDVTGDAPSFVNDLTVTPDGTAYLTDSLRAVVYRVTPDRTARGGTGALTAWADLRDRISSDSYTLNGIASGADGRHLYVVDMSGGDLYRIGTADAAVHQVALRGTDLTNGDGLELRGHTLWAAKNLDNTITRWHLNGAGTSARLERAVTDPALQVPTTLTHDRGQLLVVRSQFDKGGPLGEGTPEEPFTVASVDGI
ncbi:SMP-30/gluconolactonase/LRE family protein [Streptomyces sp. NPDC059639]|uniref:SMP-30/gluconolactonase/LRE family protein n=1 Tax=Streptomyces sp. NPDC059639 TaxID=3346891 RepID=UPI00369AC784